MGFALQLRLLLWKNYTLKKRKFHVLCFELFIPLVLFLILLIIRHYQPSTPMNEMSFTARPLPSSGIMSVMQSFCDGGVKDDDGFITFPNATLRDFLKHLNDIAQKKNYLIRPGFEPKELQSIPKIYRSIIEDPIALHSVFVNAGEREMKELLKDENSLRNYLNNHLGLDDDQINAIFDARLNMEKLHHLLFSIEKLLPNGSALSIYEFIKKKMDEKSIVWAVLAWVFDISRNTELPIDKTEFVNDIIKILVTTDGIRAFFCPNSSQFQLLKANPLSNAQFVSASKLICNLNNNQLNGMADEMRKHFDSNKVERILKLSTEWNYRSAKRRVKQFFNDLSKFSLFELTIRELSQIANSLPNDVCNNDALNNSITFDHGKNHTFVNDTINKNSTNGNDNKKHNNVEGLARVWLKMQPTICGPKVVNNDTAHESNKPQNNTNPEDGDGDDDKDREPINTFIKEQSLLLQMLYSNPTVLYAPNRTNSAAHQIINKANETFQLLDKVHNYAQILLNVSREMQYYIEDPEFQRQYLIIGRIRKEILELPKIFDLIDLEYGFDLLNQTVSIGGDLNVLKSQLNVIHNAACSWLTLTKDISLNVFKGFESENDLLEYVKKRAYSDNVTVIASVIFELTPNTTSLPPHMVYKIRQNASFIQTTALVRNRFWFPGPRNWGYGYYQFGFVWLQDILERAMISLHAGKDITDPGSYLHQFPYPCYIQDQFLFIIEHVMPLCMAISWVYSVSMLVQSIVYEKEHRLKEVMKTMGLNSLVHWMAWFITSFIQMSITAAILTITLKFGKVLTYSNGFIIFLYIEIFVIANIVFSFLVSVLYSKAKLAAACAGIIYFLSYVPFMYLAVREDSAHDNIPFWIKTLACLLSTTSFGIGAKYFAYYEEIGVGVQWNNIATSPVESDEFTLWNVLNMMILDALLYSTLVWYIENVHPGTYGLPRPWYFPLTKSYWLGTPTGEDDYCCTFTSSKLKDDGKKVRSRPPSESINLNDLIYFEAEPVNLPLGVGILNLIKQFERGTPPAVNKLSVNLYEGQITTFLGHNGAGKTTTMSILTGLFPPTSGQANIYGLDIKTDMDVIRQSMGICPQHNVLFDELTVEEHLWFYACLKNVNGGENLKEDMNKLISDLSLPIKRGKTVASLSGGMKRKLSVAMAFIGDSKVVILDEPTAGVDPYTRRTIWELIMKYKVNRTILLSTHHMDEADMISDRIAILANGHIKCCGSPLFLKHNLGEGYHLVLVKDTDYFSPVVDNEIPSADVQHFIQEYTPSAKYVMESKHEIHFVLPNNEIKNFYKLFTALETPANLVQLKIQTFGLKNSTMEEVFLKVASNWKMNSLSTNNLYNRSAGGDINIPINNSNITNYDTGFNVISDRIHVPSEKVESQKRLLFNQFTAIVFKRWCCTKRNWKGLFSQILLPAFFVCVAMSVALIAPKIQDLPPLVLSPAQYYNYTQHLGGNVVSYCERSQNQSFTFTNLSSTFDMLSGIGATCLLKSPKLWNYTELSDYDIVHKYLKLDSRCSSVLVPGIKPRVFLPVAPTTRSITESTVYSTNYMESTTMPYTKSPERYYPYCYCSSDNTGFICDSSGYSDPQSLRLITGDVLINITGIDNGRTEHEYYLYTTDKYRLKRYGALTFGLTVDYVPEDFAINVNPQQKRILRQIAIRNATKVWFNNKGFHSMPTYLNVLNNAILRANLPPKAGNPAAYGITVINHPMADTSFVLSQEQILQGSDVLIAIFIIVAMSFVPASFVLFLVYERFTKAKHLQFVSGVNVIVYWTANYFWDMCSYVVPAMCCILILLIFDIPAYTSHNNFPAVVSLFLMYGWSITPVMYPVSFIFEEPSTAYICLIIINLFVGITCIVTSFLFEAFLYFSHATYLAQIHKVLKLIFLMFPNYCLGRGLMDIAFNEYENFFLFKTGQYSKMKSPFAWDMVTRNLTAMAISGFCFFILTLLCEFNFFNIFRFRKRNDAYYRTATPIDEDCDVARERRNVMSSARDSDTVLRLVNLSKMFKKPQKHIAVNKLCIDITKGECFGLLGVNGAGKTTTFKMLTGDLDMTNGDAILNGHSILNELNNARQHIGYCPQFDALFDELTAREHLKFYARLRGVKHETDAIDAVIKRVELTPYADKLVRSYSGGTKRKLSAAIALISSPTIVFMDEPTTGMDPYTRRFLWDLVLDLVHNDNISVVLTSHSMEECEALCSRVGILVNGRFSCLGSIQHLKNRFGDGYHIIVRSGNNMPTAELIDWFATNFPSAVLKENNFNILQYEIACNPYRDGDSEATSESGSVISGLNHFSLAYIFNKLYSSGIEEYAVCQNTLDNLFVNLAKKQQCGGNFLLAPSRVKSKSKKKKKNDKPLSEVSNDSKETNQMVSTESHISLSEFVCGTSSTTSTNTTSQ